MKKDITLLISLVIVFSLLVFQITLTILTLKNKNIGTVSFEKDFYDIKFVNATIDIKTDSYMKVDEKNKTIKIRITNLNDFKNSGSFTLEILNIGTKDIILDNYKTNNTVTNDNRENTIFEVELPKESTIKPGERKKIKIIIKYNGKTNEIKYYNSEITLIFKENIN